MESARQDTGADKVPFFSNEKTADVSTDADFFHGLGSTCQRHLKKKRENQNICSEIQGNEQERFSVCEYSKLTS